MKKKKRKHKIGNLKKKKKNERTKSEKQSLAYLKHQFKKNVLLLLLLFRIICIFIPKRGNEGEKVGRIGWLV